MREHRNSHWCLPAPARGAWTLSGSARPVDASNKCSEIVLGLLHSPLHLTGDSIAMEETMSLDRIGAACQPYLLSVFRFITGLMLFQYGVAKLFKFPEVAMFAEVTPFSLYGTAGIIELVFGGMLMLGLFSRIAAFILSGEMAFAYFIEHLPVSFFPLLNEGTLAITLCFACLYLAGAGGGPLSIDALLRPKESQQRGISRG
jgi:putative oxidoreductase